MPGLSKAAYSPVSKNYFGFFQGESSGYMFKADAYPKIEELVKEMLEAEEDLSITSILYGEGQWFVHAEYKDEVPQGREFKMFKSYDAFRKGVESRVANQRALRACHCEGTMWAAYFEGLIEGKVSISVSDTVEEMLESLDRNVSDEEMSLECVCFGEGAWYAFYLENPSHETGDATWVINSDYALFEGDVKKHCDKDDSMQAVTFGAGVWFGYWEGVVDEDDGWAWHSKPTQQEFQDVIKAEFDADDEDGSEAAAAAADTTAAPPLPAETLHAGATLKRPKKKATTKVSKVTSAQSTGADDGGDDSAGPAGDGAAGDGELGEFGSFNLTLTAWPADLPEKEAAKFEKLWMKERAKAAKKFIKDAKKSKMVPEDCGELRQKTEAVLMATRKVLDEKASAAAAKAAKKKK
eukprot:m.120736 g.120736  ORF g.120736 m.120736 type:complete len:409 (-) comp17251_c0_seq1:122-1348(-)